MPYASQESKVAALLKLTNGMADTLGPSRYSPHPPHTLISRPVGGR